MEKSFEPSQIESTWYARWEASGDFKPSGHGEPYCILLPPPNVTGTLHMGHAFQQTVMDMLIRYQRMRGMNTLWQVGTDHAGIATQKIVENQLAADDKTRHDLGREKFVERVWKWKEESGSTITNQMRRIGASLDWSRERFTMDEGLSAAVRKVFVRVVSRGPDLPRQPPRELGSGADDGSVRPRSKQRGTRRPLWSIRYPASDGGEPVWWSRRRAPKRCSATSRWRCIPKTSATRSLIGKTLTLPLTGREIPVIARRLRRSRIRHRRGEDHAGA